MCKGVFSTASRVHMRSGGPGYQTCLFWSFSGTKPGCFGHSRAPNLLVRVILGYQAWLLWSFSGTKSGYCHSRAPNLVALVILGYQTWLFWSSSGRYFMHGFSQSMHTPLIDRVFVDFFLKRVRFPSMTRSIFRYMEA